MKYLFPVERGVWTEEGKGYFFSQFSNLPVKEICEPFSDFVR